MTALWQKYKSLILYGFFGVLTTLVNMGVYFLCYDLLHIPNVPSNVLAWALAVLFAFVTNRRFVFEAKGNTIVKELLLFAGARVATGALDTLIMFIGVDLMQRSALLFKVIAGVVVVILNYVCSKWIVFRK